MPCLIKKASRCAADRTSKTTTFFIFNFLCNTKIFQENHVYLFVIWLVKWWKLYILYLHVPYTKDNRLWQIKKKHGWWNNLFSDVFIAFLKHFASLFFLTKDNFMFWIKKVYFFLSTLTIKKITDILEKMFWP